MTICYMFSHWRYHHVVFLSGYYNLRSHQQCVGPILSPQTCPWTTRPPCDLTWPCLRPLGPAPKCFLPVLPLPGASVKVFLLLGSAVDSLQHWSCRHISSHPGWHYLDLAQPGHLSPPGDSVGRQGSQASWPTSWDNWSGLLVSTGGLW